MNRKQLTSAALLCAFGVAAFAQTPPAAPQAPASHRMEHEREHDKFAARMHERMAKRQAALKQKLRIGSAQEGAWNTFTASMQPPEHMQRPERGQWEKLSTPERIDRMRAMRAERNAAMDKRADAVKTFYAQLSPEQKKVFDVEAFRGRGRHEHKEHHHG